MSITAERLIVTRASGSCGAEVSGLDLRNGLDDRTAAELRAVWLEHGVIFLRDVDLPPARFLDFARKFGTPIEYPFVRGLDGFPQITPVIKEPHERINFGGVWHSDTAYLERPPMATILIAREVPPAGGDTLFADARAAYDALSPGLRATLDGLRAINSSKKADASKTREDRQKERGAVTNAEVLEASHPVVRTHPETGRKVNPAERLKLVKKAARVVWAFFVQRELCGLRDQKQIIKDYGIPGEVLGRLGAIEPI